MGILLAALALVGAGGGGARPSIWGQDNLAAWCVVPFDAKMRGPEERAQMLERLGYKHFVYDWREKDIATFDAEIDALQTHGIDLLGWWFPFDADDPKAKTTLEMFKRHAVHPQLWVSHLDMPIHAGDQNERVNQEALRIAAVAKLAASYGSRVELYNHNGWFGSEENQLAIIERLKMMGVSDVGMVYNFSHARDQDHDDSKVFKAQWARIKAHVVAVNVTGMRMDGELIYPSEGDAELAMMRTIERSGWRGWVGLIAEKGGDAEVTLRNYKTGLDWLAAELRQPGSGGARPFASSSAGGGAGGGARERLPLYKVIAAESKLTPAIEERPRGDSRWSRSNGNDGNTRYSTLAQINKENVERLQPAWVFHSGDGKGNIQANPIIVDGVLYAPTVGKNIVAVDGATGKEIWRVRPELPSTQHGPRGLEGPIEEGGYGPAQRGLTYWAGDAAHPPRIYFMANGYLMALDAKGGKQVESFGERGRAAASKGAGRSAFLGGVAPAIYKNVVVASNQNVVDGFDVVSGAPLWHFDTLQYPVAKPDEDNGGNVWGGMAVDTARGMAFIAAGDPHPNFVGVKRPGSNCCTASVIALDALTGRQLWAFQEVAHNLWDLDIPAAPNLVTVTHEGRRVDAVAQVTKLGNTLLLDRVSGRPLFSYRLRRAPGSKVPGESTAEYQPALELPQPFARQEFSLGDITNISPESHAFVLRTVEKSSYGWFEPPTLAKPLILYGVHGGAEWTGASVDPSTGWLYVSANEIAFVEALSRSDADDERVDAGQVPRTPGAMVFAQRCAVCHGERREGRGMAPALLGLKRRMTESQVSALVTTGRTAMPPVTLAPDEQSVLLAFLFGRDRGVATTAQAGAAHGGAARGDSAHAGAARRAAVSYEASDFARLLDAQGYPGSKPPWGTLNAIDLNTGRLAWKVPLGEYEELTRQGIAKTGTENFGGAMVTAGGLVFCGGTRDRMIRAFDKDTGRELWKYPLPFGGFAPPATYEIDGRQYVVIAATGGGKLGGDTGDAYVAFALPR